MTPLDYYHQYCHAGTIKPDPLQLRVLNVMQTLHFNLLEEQAARIGILSRFRQVKLVSGLYLYGNVGVGKTFLMDCFFHSLPFTNKLRLHFHAFMRDVHQTLKHYQGEKNPLQKMAKQLAKENSVLCFDELLVTDIVDAMLLGRLLQALFAEGVTLVATSNVAPDDLYYRGLQRELFLPAIKSIKQHTKVMHIASKEDYRLRHEINQGIFYLSNAADTSAKMEASFAENTKQAAISTVPIEIHGRKIAIYKEADEVAWFDFAALCQPPRSQQDYLTLTERYRMIYLSNVPLIHADEDNMINLFIRLIDVLYDANVPLIFSAANTIEKIYVQGKFLSTYQRTCSRLHEMQSAFYHQKK